MPSACATRASSARHILPNVAHIVIIALVMDFSGLVLAEAVLSYVGVGVDPSTTSFGTMINAARLEMAPRADRLVVAGGGVRLHVRAGARGQPVRRRGARRLRSTRAG